MKGPVTADRQMLLMGGGPEIKPFPKDQSDVITANRKKEPLLAVQIKSLK